MMQRTFRDLLNRLIQERGTAVLEQSASCKALLQDYAKGACKREIRLFLQCLEAGYHRKLLASEDEALTRRLLTRSLQEDYGIAGEIAEETITALADCLETRDSAEERIARLVRQAHGDYRAQYELGCLLYKLKRYEESADWFEKAARQCIVLYETREPPHKTRSETAGKPEFLRIEGQTFLMGSPNTEPNRSIDEIQHEVTVKGFFIGKYEVTQREYEAVMGTNPSASKGPDLPVEQVSWFDAVAYCNALSILEGLTPAYRINGDQAAWNRESTGYRLPTEAEWEYACRAGTGTPFSTGNRIAADQANYNGAADTPRGAYRQKTLPVGTFPANPWGLYDMHGNVYEWCWDWYWEYNAQYRQDPIGSQWGSNRVIRGGSWNSPGTALRSACRGSGLPSRRAGNLGFRIVCTSLLCVLGRA